MPDLDQSLADTYKLIDALLSGPHMSGLWHVQDAGMPVFVHTIDVALLAIERFPEWQSQYGDMDIAAVTIGSLLHDLTKASCRAHRQYTHSWVMSHEPEAAIKEAMDALDSAQLTSGVVVDHLLAEHVSHVVASHHGPWGKIAPATPEAALVHRCDLYSSQHHRMAPVDANDILPLLADGLTRTAASRHLGVSSSILRSRLLESCASEGVRSTQELSSIWAARGWVKCGSAEKVAGLERARWLMDAARKVPESILSPLAAVKGAAE